MKIVPYVRASHDTAHSFEIYDAESETVLYRFTPEEYVTFTVNVLVHSETAFRWSKE